MAKTSWDIFLWTLSKILFLQKYPPSRQTSNLRYYICSKYLWWLFLWRLYSPLGHIPRMAHVWQSHGMYAGDDGRSVQCPWKMLRRRLCHVFTRGCHMTKPLQRYVHTFTGLLRKWCVYSFHGLYHHYDNTCGKKYTTNLTYLKLPQNTSRSLWDSVWYCIVIINLKNEFFVEGSL